jgi:hypothetical protein
MQDNRLAAMARSAFTLGLRACNPSSELTEFLESSPGDLLTSGDSARLHAVATQIYARTAASQEAGSARAGGFAVAHSLFAIWFVSTGRLDRARKALKAAVGHLQGALEAIEFDQWLTGQQTET